ncbi:MULTISPECIES: hypothetical protein [unclassified Bradyrhizobium]|nr:hypothetical protein [Bradyrhizobium sp. USDA 4541]MCP1847602.1 hypothetical protein [Bradyrhizobium sp. USDA 4541]
MTWKQHLATNAPQSRLAYDNPVKRPLQETGRAAAVIARGPSLVF